jgi:glutamyl-tRNA reductase
MELTLLGVSHRTDALERREGLAFDAQETRAALARRVEGLKEALILSTCNRVELYAVGESAEGTEARLRELLREARGLDVGEQPLLAHGRHAARHLLRVAAGIESMVLGEVQIQGQVKDAWESAREAGACGPWLDRLLAAAVHTGKRARAETAIGTGAVSVASAAVGLATRIFADIQDRRVLVVGAGETGRLAARHFAERQPAALRVVNRSPERAAALAEQVGGRALAWEALGEALGEADVVVAATASREPVITAAMVARVMAGRRDRPLVLIDLAVPRDVEPLAVEGENVFLYPVDALRSVVDRSLERRLEEVPRVEAIVEQETDRFQDWLRGRDATPVVRELREHFERVRTAELERSLKSFPEGERERVDRLTRALVNKLLHLPTTRLKDCDASSAEGEERLRAARELFALDSEKVDRGA